MFTSITFSQLRSFVQMQIHWYLSFDKLRPILTVTTKLFTMFTKNQITKAYQLDFLYPIDECWSAVRKRCISCFGVHGVLIPILRAESTKSPINEQSVHTRASWTHKQNHALLHGAVRVCQRGEWTLSSTYGRQRENDVTWLRGCIVQEEQD